MPTYHRSQRLRLVGTGPKVEQLQEGRFRLTFTCTATNPNEAWMNGNKDQIMTAYGTLQSAQKNIAGIDPRTDEAYSDMVLFRTEANPSERDLIITLVYETATTAFVKAQDDKIEIGPNGLQQVTRVTIAKTGTSLPSVTVGTTSITVNSIDCLLASRIVEENDAFIQITEIYSEVGIEQLSEDIVGSQKSIVITKVGAEPTAAEAASYSDISYDSSTDWSIAKKDNSRVEGLDVYTYTFLLDNTVLSQSQDKQSSLKTEVIEVFNPKVTIDGLTLEGGATVAGNYFLSTVQSNGRNKYLQSQGDFYPRTISYTGTQWQINQFTGIYAISTDTNPDNPEDPPSTGWNGTGLNEVTQITIREFDQTLPNSLSGFELSHRYDKEGYSLINIQRSNLDGIPTMRYTFAKPSIISVTQDFVSNEVTVQAFDRTSAEVTSALDEVTSGHTLVSQREQDHDGIKTQIYQYEITSSDLIDFTADDRLQVTRTIFEVYNYDYDTNYTVGTTTANVNSTSVTLVSLKVDTKGSSGLMRLTAVYMQPKIISVNAVMKGQFSTIPMYQYRSIVSSAKTINTTTTIKDPSGTNIQTNAVFFEPDINNTSSPSTFTQNVLNTSTDLSVSGSATLVSQYEDFFDFSHPGLIEVDYQRFGKRITYTSSLTKYNRVNIDTRKASHPITTKVKCTVYNFLQRGSTVLDSDYNEGGASGLWSPNSWASVNMSVTKDYYGENPVEIPINNTYPGYRIEGSSRAESFQRIDLNEPGGPLLPSYQSALVIYNGTNFGASFYGYNYKLAITNSGPPNPEGQRWCLGVDIRPAFRDSNGNVYYNKQIVVTDVIEERKPGQLKYT